MSSDAPSAPRPARSGMRTAIVLAAIAFVLGIAVTALFIRQYRQWLPRSAQMMIESPGPASTGGADFVPPPEVGDAARAIDNDALNARQATLAAQLAMLEARAAMVEQDSRVAAGNAGRAESLLVAFAARRAIDRGLALGYIEPQLRQRFGQSQPRAVASVIQASRQPVTIEDLRQGLDTIAPDLTSGAHTDGWWASLRRELSSLVVIRHEGTPSPRAADRLARARRLLDGGQVEAALAEVGRLPGAANATAWIAAAGRYVQAHDALDQLEGAAIQGQVQGAVVSPTATLPGMVAQPAALTQPAAPSQPVPAPTAGPVTTTATATLPATAR